MIQELRDGLADRFAVRHNHPYGTRCLQAVHQVSERAGAHGAVVFGLLDRIPVEIEGHHLVVPLHEPGDHVATHLSESDKSNAHELLLLVFGTGDSGRLFARTGGPAGSDGDGHPGAPARYCS